MQKVYKIEKIEKGENFENILIEAHIKNTIGQFIRETNITDFKCEIKTTPIDDIQLYDLLDNHRKDNGVYFYRGCQCNYEELKLLLKHSFVNLEVVISYLE